MVVVATPIGNLADLSPRAREVLESADLILAEDTRVFLRLAYLAKLKVGEVRSYYGKFHMHDKDIVLAIEGGKRIAVVCDAGTPGISDPGNRIVALADRVGAPVSVVPGPSALTAALALWPRELKRFTFAGFAPGTGEARSRFIDRLLASPDPVVCYESPARISRLVDELAALDPSREIMLLAELTKAYERRFVGEVSSTRAWLASVSHKGEWAVVVAGTDAVVVREADDVASALAGSSLGTKEAASLLSKIAGVRGSEAYRTIVGLRSNAGG